MRASGQLAGFPVNRKARFQFAGVAASVPPGGPAAFASATLGAGGEIRSPPDQQPAPPARPPPANRVRLGGEVLRLLPITDPILATHRFSIVLKQ